MNTLTIQWEGILKILLASHELDSFVEECIIDNGGKCFDIWCDDYYVIMNNGKWAMKDILTFKTDEHAWLSNMTLVNIECDGIIYPSIENFYQACKYNEIHTKKSISRLNLPIKSPD